jgi:hypothetical protein
MSVDEILLTFGMLSIANKTIKDPLDEIIGIFDKISAWKAKMGDLDD